MSRAPESGFAVPPGSSGTANEPIELVFATYNIHGCATPARSFDPHRIAATIEQTGASVVALQEVGVHENGIDQAAAIAKLLGMDPVFGPNIGRDGGRRCYGNAILSRMPILDSVNYDLSVRGAEPRGCLVARVRCGKDAVTVASVHLGLRHGERTEQARRLVGESVLGPMMEERSLIVGGDMNDWFPGRDTRLLRGFLLDAATGKRHETSEAAHGGRRPRATYPARFPLFRLDHVFVGREVSVLSCEPLRTPLARTASDHLPVMARLRIPLRTTARLSERKTAY